MITVLENYSIENIFPGEGVRGITSFSWGGVEAYSSEIYYECTCRH